MQNLFLRLLSSVISFTVKVKWGKEIFPDIEVNTDESPIVFKAQLYALTGVAPERQKVMIKGVTLKDNDWANFVLKDVKYYFILISNIQRNISGCNNTAHGK